MTDDEPCGSLTCRLHWQAPGVGHAEAVGVLVSGGRGAGGGGAGGVAMAVQATCYGDPSSDCVLLLQHRGIQSAKHSAAAAAAALTPDTIGDCSIRMVAGDASNGTALPSSPLPASAAAADQAGAAKSSLTDGRADVVAKADTKAQQRCQVDRAAQRAAGGQAAAAFAPWWWAHGQGRQRHWL